MVSAFASRCSQIPSVGHLFLSFLHYYGHVFDCAQMLVVGGEYVVLRSEENVQDCELVIADLFNPATNAAGSVVKFQAVKALFQKVYNELLQGVTKEILTKADSALD